MMMRMMLVDVRLGRYYRTESGEKIGPMLRIWGSCGTLFGNGGNIDDDREWFTSGACSHDNHAIIAEWQDEPVRLDAESQAAIDELEDHRAPQPRSKYHRVIKGVELDIYDILVAWGVTCPARQHAIKKLLMAGQRGAKGVVQDLDEAIQATERAKELAG